MSLMSKNARLFLIRATIGATVVGSSLALACSTPTKVTSEWRDPSRVPRPMQRVVVIALRLPSAQRHTLEDKLVASLGESGMASAPSYQLLGEALPDSATAHSVLTRAGYDGALVVTMLGITEEPTYVPGDAAMVWGGPFWGSASDSGYIVTDETVAFDSTLWDLRDGKLAWTMTTETDNPKSAPDFAKSLSGQLVAKLVRLGFIARQR